MEISDLIVICLAKLAAKLSRMFNLGAGVTWPGEIALILRPSLLKSFSKQQRKIIFVAGTNGKTTTVKMLETIVKLAGLKIHHNESGANLENGILATFIEDTTLNGALKSQIYIFEVDEAALAQVLPKITADTIVLLNLFRDQLDRYGEVDTIADKWLITIKIHAFKSTLIVNADDPHLALIGKKLPNKIFYFGLEDENLYLKSMQHATDTIYCPNCGQRLTFGGVYYSHLGKWACGHCGLIHPEVQLKSKDFVSPLEGVYNKYNTLAAAAIARTVKLDDTQIKAGLTAFTPAFGRMEEVTYQGKKIKILLSKNPAGFNESLRTAINSAQKGPLLLVLNDRIPDGTDVSWIWDVDFEILKNYSHLVFVTGERYLDMALRLKYAEVKLTDDQIASSTSQAIDNALKTSTDDEILWVMATYSGMLNIREIVTGKKIL
jgi:lipid II isoglutaminyl synthase (glutamine-hydrolysing)